MRKLYLGLDLPPEIQAVHYPVIRIEPVPLHEVQKAFSQLPNSSHLLFTSKSAVRIFFEYLKVPLPDLQVLCVGERTAAAVRSQSVHVHAVATDETSEGIVQLLQNMQPKPTHVFWPHSALSRRVIPDYLMQAGISFTDCVLYSTQLNRPEPVPDLILFDEIVFTSPSTVDGFLAIYESLPIGKKLTCIGPITLDKLQGVQP